MTNAEFEQLRTEVAEWNRRNFPNNTALHPLLGMIEELGELCHGVLKGMQGIRHTPEECVKLERDAIGDLAIFFADFMTRYGAARHIPDPLLKWLGPVYMQVGLMLVNSMDGYPCSSHGLLGAIYAYSKARGWDLKEIVDETWAKVRERNWKANPATGEPV